MNVLAPVKPAGASFSFCCPHCHGPTGVVDSRPSERAGGIRRRRKCQSCGFRFRTMEVADLPARSDNKKRIILDAFERAETALNETRSLLNNYLKTDEWDEL